MGRCCYCYCNWKCKHQDNEDEHAILDVFALMAKCESKPNSTASKHWTQSQQEDVCNNFPATWCSSNVLRLGSQRKNAEFIQFLETHPSIHPSIISSTVDLWKLSGSILAAKQHTAALHFNVYSTPYESLHFTHHRRAIVQSINRLLKEMLPSLQWANS